MSKSLLLSVILFLSVNNYLHAQVKIGSAGTPNSNAVLELDGGTSKGLLLPKLTATEITALTAAPDGLIVYNKTDNFLYIRKSAAWQKISDATNGGGGLTLPYSGSAAAGGRIFGITNSSTGDAIWGTGTSGDGVTGISSTGNGGFFTSSGGGAALVTNKGNVGIGTISPAFPMDVNGRMRIRSGDVYNSAGIYFDKIYTQGTQSSFLGVFNDSTLGIYDITNNGWKFFFDHRNNNLGINQSDPKAPLSFSNATGNKVDIYYGSTNSRYGIGLQAALMQLYSASANDDIAFGYGSSTAFTERMRIKGNGNVGIGIAPTEKFEIRTGNAEVGWKHSWAGGSLVSVAPSLLTPAVIRGNSAAVQLTTNTNVGLYVKLDGTIGAGVINPSRQLDVNGRMRIRGTVNDVYNSAGIYFDGVTATERAFIGIETNDKIGVFGAGSGWGLSMNVNSGNTNMYNSVAIGTTAAPNSKLQVAGSVSMPYTSFSDNYTATDNDYTLQFIATLNTGVVKVLYLPPASGRNGRIYKISAQIPYSGPAGCGTFTPTQLTVVESGTGTNVIASNFNIPFNALAVFSCTGGVNNGTRTETKQLNLTVQSNGSVWKVIEDSFLQLAFPN